jgi:DNA end-binding protein Ku
MSSATLSFGLVSIPVKVFSASSPGEQVSFNLLHKTCGGRLKQQYVCPTDGGAVVERDDMVKGYEFQKGRYVTFTAEELAALEPEATQAVEIVEFVPAGCVDPVYFDKPYYLGPDKGADKPYKLLCAAMNQTGRVALAKYAARGKQYLVMVRPREQGLVMQQLHYADEVRSFSEVPVGEAAVADGELRLAVQLVEQIARDQFHPEAYSDEGKQRVLALIQKKIEGQEITVAASEAPLPKVIDLMEALRASLGQAKATTPSTPAPEAAAAAEMAPDRKPAKRVGREPRALNADTSEAAPPARVSAGGKGRR